jgi:hypothetical protein
MKDLLKKFFEEQGFFVDFENHTEPDGKVKKGEKVIGEMNDLEKGLYSFISAKEKENVELITKMQEADEAGNYETLKKLMPEHAQNHRTIDLACKIMWASIESRFETSEEATATGIREGFKVVEMYEKEGPSGHRMIIPGIGAIISMRM